MGWFDGNPAHLWEHPPVEAARRYVEFMGGAEAVLEKARALVRGRRLPLGRRGRQPRRLRRARQRGGPRAAGRRARAARLRRRERDLAQLLPDRREGAARGHRRHPDRGRAARHRRPASPSRSCSTRWRSASTARAPGSSLRIDWVVTDPDEEHALTVRNGVLRHRPGRHDPAADAALDRRARGARPAAAQNRRPRRARRERPAAGRGRRREAGRAARPARRARPGFAIVTPD